MTITNIHEAKTHLSRLIAQVSEGSEIVIGKAGKPVARLIPYQGGAAPQRKPGYWKGKVRLERGFGRLPPKLKAAFRGEHP